MKIHTSNKDAEMPHEAERRSKEVLKSLEAKKKEDQC